MYINQTYSTSTLLREQYSPTLPDLYTIRTGFQMAGRGQAGNTWESERDKNLLFSTLLQLGKIPVSQSFQINMAVSLALHSAVSQTMGTDNRLRIKWPNDLYYGDGKIAGVLIENQLIDALIAWSIVGIGLNVNQTQWSSSAPNPVSMKQVTGCDYDLETILQSFLAALPQWLNTPAEERKQAYMQRLYRRNGLWPYIERRVDMSPTTIAPTSALGQFMAQVTDITPDGQLVLQHEDGAIQQYHFKQIRFVI